MDLTIGVVLVAVAATLVGATLQGAVGFGMNLVTVPALALVVPEALPAVVIVLGVPMSIGMVRHELHSVDRAGVAWVTAGRLPGSILGATIVALASTTTLKGIIGVIVLLLVLSSAIAPPIPLLRSTQVGVGLVAGITGTAAGIGGPPVALLYQRHSGPAMRSTLAATFLAGTLLSLTTLGIAGEVTVEQLVLGVALTPAVVAGTLAGRRFHGWLDTGWTRTAVLCVAAIAAVTVIGDALL